MISYHDPDYLRTRAIKRGEAHLPPHMADLADWIGDRFSCERPLNLEFEWCDPAQSHRLQVVFERQGTDRLFIDAVGNFDSAKQAQVAAQLRSSKRFEPRDLEAFFVIFTAFERAARCEANAAMGQRIHAIQRAIDDPRIWLIRQEFDSATLFVQSDEQLSSLTDDHRDLCRDAYMTELLPHDEFGYFAARPIALSFDSKESFERDHAGSWFAYDRR